MSVIKNEIEKFTLVAKDWWDPTKLSFKMLHEINPVRLQYITDSIRNYFKFSGNDGFKKLKILDVGCGGGIASIPLAKLGASVLGIDAGEENIEAAKNQSQKLGIDTEFKCQKLEKMQKDEVFDVVLCLEVIEHVEDPEKFIKNLSLRVKKGGLLILSTINKTLKSKLLAIYAAEYILRLIPAGTHSWEKFIKPSDLIKFSLKCGLQCKDISGISFSLLKQEWEISKDIDVNFIALLER
ncbi:MAG: bifunctional 2-polyprenyl-6-hydroxyphenol methylase/3-demethylubiquinol 3-O-methyltransferase UbiG [Rickettsiaceae bacterium]|nr:bifunctional 2-polyprenyl-6-hydroxyphenol methylase/3-demethylubiquinol 3-O-methyltransferase UbiG [Rickettsiaceae bacterium]